nr:unnamed protein product [Digitaria exilis]
MPSSPSTASTDGSASSIAAGAASGYHLLKIEGYSNIKSTIPNGKHVESHPFRAAGRTWSIKYYPNGECPDTADYISIFLVLKEAVTNHLMVQLVFSFIDEVEKHKPSYVRAAKVHKFDSHESWGYDKFVKRAELEQSGRLKDDCFTVRCDIVVIGEPRTKANTLPGSSFVVAPPPDSSHHLGALLLGGKGADVRYGKERLKLICEERLCRYIDVSTVATSLALAEQHRCQGLKKACFKFLKSPKTLDEVMATDGFQHLAKSSPSALFELMSKLAER